ncbi:hypothetical protein LLG96_14630 [bacterium]|nr:hypothetical protein [bacterium]
MKNILRIALITIALFSINGIVWCTTYYVDPVNGYDVPDPSWGQSTGQAYRTIKYAISKCSTNDIVKLMDGDFVEVKFNTPGGGGEIWDGVRHVQIFVDKQITIEREDGDPTIIGFNYDYPAEGGNDLDDIMLIDQTDVEINDITFDGYYYATGDTVKTNNVIYITPDADGTQVLYCNFTNFGSDAFYGGGYDFYSIVGGGWPKTESSNRLYNVKINYNNFYGNPFASVGAHEIYLNYASDAEIKYNNITNNGKGIPLKLKDGCISTDIIGNTVHGANTGFIYDEYVTYYSSETIVTDNTFDDSYGVINENEYLGPFRPTANHIKLFEDNTIYEFSTADTKHIQGLAYKSSANDLYAAQKNSSHTEAIILPNPNAPSPDNGYGFSADNYYCQGDMCTTSAYVVFCTQYSGTQRVYKDYIDGDFDNGANPSDYLSVGQYETVTALSSYDDNSFLTAIRDTGNSEVRIYQSTTSDLTYSLKLYKSFTFADSITAIACNGTDIVFATYKNGTSKIYNGTLNDLNNATKQGNDISGYVSSMCFARGNLVTAVYDNNSQLSKLYYGSSSNPTNYYTGNYAYIIFLALAGDYGTGNENYMYSLVHDTSGGNNCKKIYFTKDVTDYDDQLYFYSQWYRDF